MVIFELTTKLINQYNWRDSIVLCIVLSFCKTKVKVITVCSLTISLFHCFSISQQKFQILHKVINIDLTDDDDDSDIYVLSKMP